MSANYKEIWDTLNKVSMDKIKDKKGKFDYLSWTDMWQEIHKYFPEVDYEFKEFDNPTYGTMDCLVYPDGSASVHCKVTIKGVTRTMWLAVTDYNNNAKKDWNVVDIANTKMRCLTKCMSMFGLGAHIYRGEDLEDRVETEEIKTNTSNQQKINGFILKRLDSDEVSIDETPVSFIQSIRVQMGLLNDEQRRELFSLNTNEIERAYLSIQDKDVTLKQSYEKMVDLYA